MTVYEALGHDLEIALARLAARRRRRRTVARFVAAAATVATLSTTVALASTGLSLADLDPTEWTILHRGELERGQYVHARNNRDGGESLFMEERDADLAPYAVFLLHERNVAKAEAESGIRSRPESGPLCTPEQLTRGERIALQALASVGPPGLTKDAATKQVDQALAAAFAGDPCTGLRWASERARWVYAGVEPADRLMPGARTALARG